jgi:glycerol-3-phosphate dehydrogenase (NAD(P)+)
VQPIELSEIDELHRPRRDEAREGLDPRHAEVFQAHAPGDGLEAAEALDGTTAIILAVPAKFTGDVVRPARPQAPDDAPWVLLGKGLERGTGRRLSEVALDQPGMRREQVFAFLGPSHAEEVVKGQPTAIVLAGPAGEARSFLQRRLSGPGLRVYTNDDLAGVELAAAVKNVLAIAAGLGDGLGLGDNGRGALLTRGVAELARLGVAFGGHRETFFGLAGIGDMVTTCLSQHSRNRRFGELVARGHSVQQSLDEIGQVVEGVDTARTVVELADAHGVAVPIAREVAAVLFDGKDPAAALDDLMQRSLKGEWDDTPPEGEDVA